MIEKLIYKEVEIEAPDHVEYFLLFRREKNSSDHQKWFWAGMDHEVESLKRAIDYNLESDKEYYSDKEYEYKTYSVMLPY